MENIEECIKGQTYCINKVLSTIATVYIGGAQQALHKRMAKQGHDAKLRGNLLVHQAMKRRGNDHVSLSI